MSSLRLVLALALASFATSAAAAPRMPGVPDAVRPHYSSTKDGFKHFCADELQPLVVGEAFTWDGKRYEVTRLRSIVQHDVSRWNPAQRNDAVPARGRVVAVIQLTIDGVLKSARIEGVADYVTQPDGWRWNKVLLYLGTTESYDFVTGETD